MLLITVVVGIGIGVGLGEHLRPVAPAQAAPGAPTAPAQCTPPRKMTGVLPPLMEENKATASPPTDTVSAPIPAAADYCIVGGGPGGLQLGQLMLNGGRDYVLFEPGLSRCFVVEIVFPWASRGNMLYLAART